MTPDPPDRALVQGKLRLLRTLLDDLRPYQGFTADDLLSDRTARYVVERILSSLVDVAVGLNSHILVASGRPAPDDQRSSFIEAAALGALDKALAERLAPSAGLRNVLVHEYAEIDLVKVAAAITEALQDFGSYVTAVARWATT